MLKTIEKKITNLKVVLEILVHNIATIINKHR